MPARYLSAIATAALAACAWSFSAAPAPAQTPADGPDSLLEIYTDWTVACAASQDAGRFCRMQQPLGQTAERGPVLNLFLREPTEAEQDNGTEAVFTLRGPLGVALNQPLTILVAEEPVFVMQYMTCTGQGCVAQAALDDIALAAMRAGAAAVVSMPLANGQVLQAEASLAGFTAAWTRLGDL